jgi:hypothetical protein
VANKRIDIGQSTKEQGPMISVYSAVNSGQTGTMSFPSVDFAPSGGAGLIQPMAPGFLLPALDFS